jgi:hypothetical protein
VTGLRVVLSICRRLVCRDSDRRRRARDRTPEREEIDVWSKIYTSGVVGVRYETAPSPGAIVRSRYVRDRPEEDVMPQYAVLLYENVPPDELPPDVQAAHLAMPERVTGAGGRILAGMALHESSTATAIRGELLTDGPFIETKEELAGVFVIEARDLDHAVELARMTPIVEGGVEVRPLVGFEVLEGP